MSSMPSASSIFDSGVEKAEAQTAMQQWHAFTNERLNAGGASEAELAASRASLKAARDLQPVSASVAANALTLTLNPTSLEFRHPTLGNGSINTRTVAAALSLVISSGSTLGTVSGQHNRIAVLAVDTGSAVELAAVNADGGFHFDESRLISTTAEGGAGAADSASVVYSATARSNVPWQLVGYMESTQTTAGTWATAPSKVQGAGCKAVQRLVNHAQGDAPMFATRAWGHMNGTGTIALNASGNVASITDLGTGTYRVTFTTAMPHANYHVSVQAKDDGTARLDSNINSRAVGQFEFSLTRTGSSTLADSADISFQVVC